MSKTKLLFLPGTMCDETLWHKLWPLLAADFDLQHIPIPKKASLAAMADALYRELGAGKFNLVGFSLGGYLASFFASRYPDSVAKLMVLANSPCALPQDELMQRQKIISWLAHTNYKGANAERIRPLLGIRGQKDEAMIAHIQQMEQNLGLEQLLPQLSATSEREDLLTFCNQTDIEVRFVFGQQDILVRKAWYDNITNPKAQVTNVGEFGHMLPLEAPKEVARQILGYFCVNESKANVTGY